MRSSGQPPRSAQTSKSPTATSGQGTSLQMALQGKAENICAFLRRTTVNARSQHLGVVLFATPEIPETNPPFPDRSLLGWPAALQPDAARRPDRRDGAGGSAGLDGADPVLSSIAR